MKGNHIYLLYTKGNGNLVAMTTMEIEKFET